MIEGIMAQSAEGHKPGGVAGRAIALDFGEGYLWGEDAAIRM
jgi:hypothetical protein